MGALTAKPYAFRYRPWELQAIETFDFLDAFCSPILIDVRGLQVIRILPRPLNFNNDVWINDRTRFFMDGLKRQRLGTPLFKNNTFNIEISWKSAFDILKSHIKDTKSIFHGVAGSVTTFPVLKQFKHFINCTGSEAIRVDCYSAQFDKFELPSLNSLYDNKESFDAVILLNSNLQREFPLLNANFRQLSKKIPIFSFGFINDSYIQNLGSLSEFIDIVKGKSKLTKLFGQYKKILVLVGLETSNNILISSGILSNFLNLLIKQRIIIFLSYAPTALNGIPAAFLNVKNVLLQCTAQSQVLYLLNSDSVNITPNAYSLVIYQGSHGSKGASMANLILPSETIFESKDAYSFSLDGSYIKYNYAYPAPAEARSQLSVFSMLLKYLDYNILDTPIVFKRLFSNQVLFLDVVFNKIYHQKTTHLLHNFYLKDAITRASPTLAIASSRFKKIKEIRNNFSSN